MTQHLSSAWRFPIERLALSSAVLCLHRTDPHEAIYCEGGRLEFAPLDLPDINFSYAQSTPTELHVLFELPRFDFTGLEALSGQLCTPSEEWCRDHYGSVYAFSAHNPVDTLAVQFGVASAGTIPAVILLRFDFTFEGRIGGVVQRSFTADLSLERRWEL